MRSLAYTDISLAVAMKDISVIKTRLHELKPTSCLEDR